MMNFSFCTEKGSKSAHYSIGFRSC